METLIELAKRIAKEKGFAYKEFQKRPRRLPKDTIVVITGGRNDGEVLDISEH